MAAETYQDLTVQFRQISAVDHALSMLHWDRATMMPTGAAAVHADNAAELAALRHDLLTATALSNKVREIDAEALPDPWHQANIRSMRRLVHAAEAVPRELVMTASRISADAEMTWRQARKNNDFAALLPKLTAVVEVTREVAAARGDAFALAPYDALLDRYETGLTQAHIDPLFADLAKNLPPLLEKIEARQSKIRNDGKHDWALPVVQQRQLAEKVMRALGFDFDRGRLDVSLHPFTGGVPDDVRITTRYDAEDPLTGLMAVIHETGHALYAAGLPAAHRHQPVGGSMGMAIHESQSLLLEMQVGRDRAFLQFLLPLLQSMYAAPASAPALDDLQQAVQHVARGLIRVDADEVTYPLHIILRYRLEQALLKDDLSVADLPGAWNAGMQELLGVVPPSDADGVMQDIHWPMGAFGYFPTYTLGALAAADFFATAKEALPELENHITAGEFTPLLAWLREHIHAKGRLHSDFQELLQSVSGRKLGVATFYDHLRARYLQEADAQQES